MTELFSKAQLDGWVQSATPFVDDFDKRFMGTTLHILPCLLNDDDVPLHGVEIENETRRFLPCFGELHYGWWGQSHHNRVAGFLVGYSEAILRRAICVPQYEAWATELTNWMMSRHSPWWPMPLHVEIRDRFAGLPRLMLVHDTNCPATLLTNFLIAFRSMIFDGSTLRTYMGLRQRGWSITEAFYGTTILWADDHRTPHYSTEHRQVEFPITGSSVALGLSSFAKFRDCKPTVLPGMAFWKHQTGIPNNIIWDRRQGKAYNPHSLHAYPDVYDVAHPVDADPKLINFMGWTKPSDTAAYRHGWMGRPVDGGEINGIREFILGT